MMNPRYRTSRRGAVVLLAAGIMLSAGVGAAIAAAAAAAPTATTGDVASVLPTSAVVTGTVNPNGSVTTWHFEYSLSSATSYTSSTTAQSAGAGTTDVGVTATLSGLVPSTNYRYRIVATNSAGTTDGAAGLLTTSATPVTTTTPPHVAPSVTTGHVASVTPISAVVTGTVNPNGSATTWRFEYSLGSATSYTSSTAAESAGAGTTNVAVSATLTGLAPATSYIYRIVATNSTATTYGAAGVVDTSAAPGRHTGCEQRCDLLGGSECRRQPRGPGHQLVLRVRDDDELRIEYRSNGNGGRPEQLERERHHL